MGRGRAGSIDIRENVSKNGSLGGLLVHGAWSPDLPHPGFLKQGKMEEECFAPCRRSKTTQAAREGRSSEPGRPPKVPGDGPVGEKSVFRGHRQKWFLSFEMTSQKLWKNSEMPLDGPWTVPENDFSTKSTPKSHWNNVFRIFPDTRLGSEDSLDPI